MDDRRLGRVSMGLRLGRLASHNHSLLNIAIFTQSNSYPMITISSPVLRLASFFLLQIHSRICSSYDIGVATKVAGDSPVCQVVIPGSLLSQHHSTRPPEMENTDRNSNWIHS
jgi:hypothetical protein